MLPQDAFVAARSRDWDELDHLLVEGRELHELDGPSISRAAALYRSLCNDLTRCRGARYSPDLVGYLNGLAGRAHNALYGTRPMRTTGAVRLVARDFPRTLRKRWKFFVLSAALFIVPWIVGQVGAMASPDFAMKVLPAAMLEGMADAYSEGFDAGRSAGTDAGMAGFYVFNNVGIAFRCFATGVLFGLGSVFFLVYNGLFIGTVTGYVAASGHGANILTFMCGHGPFELTAIVISGGAGLQMGYALIETGGRTRFGSLRRQSREIAHLVLGAALMLLIAAAIEAFWSPSAAPPVVKWAVAAVLTAGVTLYLVLAGRGPESPARAERPLSFVTHGAPPSSRLAPPSSRGTP
jgi:uncharacterized membrane protein SpoIIM required for sporulation